MDKVNVMHDSEVARKRKFLKKSTIYIILMAFTIVNAYPIFLDGYELFQIRSRICL